MAPASFLIELRLVNVLSIKTNCSVVMGSKSASQLIRMSSFRVDPTHSPSSSLAASFNSLDIKLLVNGNRGGKKRRKRKKWRMKKMKSKKKKEKKTKTEKIPQIPYHLFLQCRRLLLEEENQESFDGIVDLT